jgi:hypothetical protein
MPRNTTTSEARGTKTVENRVKFPLILQVAVVLHHAALIHAPKDCHDHQPTYELHAFYAFYAWCVLCILCVGGLLAAIRRCIAAKDTHDSEGIASRGYFSTRRACYTRESRFQSWATPALTKR